MPPLPNIPEWDQSERLKHERELTGFYISSHPLARYEATIQALATASTISLPELSDGREVKLCGIITTVKSMLTKKGDRMAYLTLEDLQGVVEIIVFPDLYKNAADLIVPERLVRITGTVDRGDKGTKIRGSKIEPLAEVQAQTIKRVQHSTDGSPRRDGTVTAPPRGLSASPGKHDRLAHFANGFSAGSRDGPPPSPDRHPQRTLCGRC